MVGSNTGLIAINAAAIESLAAKVGELQLFHGPAFSTAVGSGFWGGTKPSVAGFDFEGFDGGSPAVQGTDSLDGGTPTTVGPDTITGDLP